MAQARVEEHESVEVRIIRRKRLRLMQCMEILHISSDFHQPAQPRLHHRAERIRRRASGQRELIIPIRHTLGPDEEEMESCVSEEVGELDPEFAGEGGFGAGAEDEEADGGWVGPEAGDGYAGACKGGVEGIPQC